MLGIVQLQLHRTVQVVFERVSKHVIVLQQSRSVDADNKVEKRF